MVVCIRAECPDISTECKNALPMRFFVCLNGLLYLLCRAKSRAHYHSSAIQVRSVALHLIVNVLGPHSLAWRPSVQSAFRLARVGACHDVGPCQAEHHQPRLRHSRRRQGWRTYTGGGSASAVILCRASRDHTHVTRPRHMCGVLDLVASTPFGAHFHALYPSCHLGS